MCPLPVQVRPKVLPCQPHSGMETNISPFATDNSLIQLKGGAVPSGRASDSGARGPGFDPQVA